MGVSRLLSALQSQLPPLPIIRVTLKASIALTVALICVLVKPTREAIGNASTLATLGTLLYFPIQPIGSHIKTTVYGVVSILVGAAWCFLGNYVANASRDRSVSSAMQPVSSGISALFCMLLIFFLSYIKTKYPQVQFGTVFAGMIGSFALTQNAALPGFQPSLTLTFVMPLVFSTAIALAVNTIFWPEDDTSKYFAAFTDLLKDYKAFLQESTTTFCNRYPSTSSSSITIGDPSPSAAILTLPTLRTKLQQSLVKLMDTQHEIDHVLLYGQLSQHDLKQLTQSVKKIRAPLHGIGISLLMSAECTVTDSSEDRHKIAQENFSDRPSVLHASPNSTASLSTQLIESCILAMTECEQRIQQYKQPNRTFASTFFWPFVRLLITSTNTENTTLSMPSQKLRSIMASFIDSLDDKTENKPKRATLDKHSSSTDDSAHQAAEDEETIKRDLDRFFKFNLAGVADSICSLLEKLEYFELNKSNKKRRFWFPHTSKRCLKPSDCSKPQFGGQIYQQLSSAASPISSDSGSSFVSSTATTATMSNGDTSSQTELYRKSATSQKQTTAGLSIQMDTIDAEETIHLENQSSTVNNISQKPCPRDPDVDAPTTSSEKFFSFLSRMLHWIYSMETVFAIKTAAGFILLSLPAYLPQSVGWFTYWGGQWVANTLLMWMIPMAGLYNFTILLGLLGSICGAVSSIVVWEISRGNPYGLAILSFIVFVGCQYIFFTKQLYNYTAIMTLYTYLMIITFTYQNEVGSPAQHDDIWLTAGKRLVFVCLGIIGSFIVNLIPRPVTGRIELRLRISRTIRDLSILYGIIFTSILDGQPLSAKQEFKLRQFTLCVQRQLKDEETFLRYSKLEPPLKGKFPYHTYQPLLERLNNMADLVEGMAYTSQAFLNRTGETSLSSKSRSSSWKQILIQGLGGPTRNSTHTSGDNSNVDKVDYIVCVQSTMQQLSICLKSKLPLPPCLILPDDLRNKVSHMLDSVLHLADGVDADPAVDWKSKQSKSDGYSAYCAFSIATTLFIQELNEAAICVENLVGVENPQIWLSRYA